MHSLHEIAGESSLANPYHDVSLLRRYEQLGGDLDKVLYLSLGETWSEVAPGLVRALRESVPLHGHGYILTPYGLPALREVLRGYVTDSHRLAGVAELGVDYEVAVSQSSTRSAMFHYGRLLREETADTGARPLVVCSSPGWDYAGVFTALGYGMRHFAVRPEDAYQPRAAEVEELLRRSRGETTGPLLLVLNAQHNPTGADWDERTVRRMVRAAAETGAAVLVDDAYYAVHDPHTPPTSALRVLLEEYGPAADPAPGRSWLAVRSLGKQFHCNGWGIGALTAPPRVLEALLGRLLPQHGYVSSVPLQAAMAAWLADEESETFLAAQRADYAQKRQEIAKRLVGDLGYPDEAFHAGSCGAYLLMRTPPRRAERATAGTDAAPSGRPGTGRGAEQEPGESFREFCLRRTGVLVGEAHMSTPGERARDPQGFVRLFLGPQQGVLTEALARLADAGLGWTDEAARG
ncbi:pyridoxal phosphate-dependent aminotransferase [Streptomyces sp. XM4193]|uniref:pyridoxal phosphate-dependent aminotransferase n=1 Tax=Streptomyces sp. XM4193 TaxID=2929782 RepID=UPI001FFBFDE1|nr:pyridoxal phosphate-dependent aminotransferase [Streptomyces sp. XM4193]MCK1795000.1 pyridoxal phosphate-dependent aminotransferase [Streptomyces sp. XM4193]